MSARPTDPDVVGDDPPGPTDDAPGGPDEGRGAPGRATGGERNPRGLRLTRDLDLLRGLASDVADEGIGVVRLATMIGREKSQVSRSLRALVEAGLVERDPTTGRFRLGLELYALAAATAQRRLLTVAPEVLRGLAAELDETVHLCTLHGTDVLTLRSESPPARATAWGAWEGETAPAHATSSGRALLATLTPSGLRDRYRELDLEGLAPHSRAQSLDDLERVLAEVRLAGSATVREEHERGAIGIACAIHDFRGDAVAAVNVSGDLATLDARVDEVVARVTDAAARISRLLGARTTADGGVPRRPT
ncbi:MAG: IclR family transcriptional regulator [Solirubrobacteraceae bacterium]|nr:IclR family transcriptional regulator [Solirubrobacteraceae bacterium]